MLNKIAIKKYIIQVQTDTKVQKKALHFLVKYNILYVPNRQKYI